MQQLKIAIQKSGRLNEDSLKILKECGIAIDNGRDQLKANAKNFGHISSSIDPISSSALIFYISGTDNSITRSVITIANTPSLKASIRLGLKPI